MTATRVPAELPISEARAILTDIATAAKEHGATTTLTKHGKPYAKVVPLDHADGAAVLARIRQFADELRGYCSPHGVAADYADRLDGILNDLEGTSHKPAVTP